MRTIQDLQQKQALPLNIKVRLTQARIREWINEFDESGVYVSFSGGKDSTVLLHLVRENYPNVPAVFVDTGLEYPEIREFVKTFENVIWLKPKMNFKKVIENYGYPFISKEVSERVYYSQKYLRWYVEKNDIDSRPSLFGIMDLCGVSRGSESYEKGKKGIIPKECEEILREFAKSGERGSVKISQLFGEAPMHDGKPTQYNYQKWAYLVFAPFLIGSRCCNVMKKNPVHNFERKTGRVPITGQMASESRLRQQKWIMNGCNAFNSKHKISNPMSFWTEQDVLLYIYQHHIPIASVYGDVVKEQEVDGQIDFSDYMGIDVEKPILKTTGCNRTGCMFCGYGCHLEKEGEGRFERMKETHPKQYEWIMKPWEEGGLGYKKVIDWINENGGLNIRY